MSTFKGFVCKKCGGTDIRPSNLCCKPHLCMGCGLLRPSEVKLIYV